MSKPAVTVSTTVETTTRYKMTEEQVAEACIQWLEVRNKKVFDSKPDVDFDCSMGGMFRDATITVKTRSQTDA